MNHTRVACTKPLDKLRTLSLRFDDGAGRAASKLFQLMLNDSQHLLENFDVQPTAQQLRPKGKVAEKGKGGQYKLIEASFS
ncbi:unnamed protein product [Aureobasidium pullulans]|nr:unnamed protein product [Aureobasidium pullulans]